MIRVYKAGRRLPAGNGIASLLANPQWSHTFLQDIPTVTRTMQVCSRRTPFFVCATLEAAIEAGIQPAGRLPQGTIVEVWEAETPEAFSPPSWVPHPDRATPEWFSFWHSLIGFDGALFTPYPEITETYFHHCPVPAHTLLCFELTLLSQVCCVPFSRGA